MEPKEEETEEDKGEGTGFFSGLFGTSKPNAPAESASAMDVPEIEPRGPALSEESQAGGAKKRKRRTLRKRRSIRKSHTKPRNTMKSRKIHRKSRKHVKKY